MTDVEFNPNAKDGDGDGLIQEGTPFERPIEDAEINPVEEPVAEEIAVVEEPVVVEESVIVAPEPVEEKPAIVPVADGVIGSGKVKKKAEPKKVAEAPQPKSDKVALFAARNLVWQGVGKLVKGYNFVGAEVAEKWLTLDAVREATPEEIKAKLG